MKIKADKQEAREINQISDINYIDTYYRLKHRAQELLLEDQSQLNLFYRISDILKNS